MSDDQDSDERDQITKNYDEIVTGDIEVFKLGNLVQRKMMIILRNNVLKIIGWI